MAGEYASQCMVYIKLNNFVRTPIPITDSKTRVIAVGAGRPAKDPTWDPMCNRATQAINGARDEMSFSLKDVLHRRCDDPSKAVGASFGGGQKVIPYLLPATPIPTIILGSGNASAIRHQCGCLREPAKQY
jgi:hypothetical protein